MLLSAEAAVAEALADDEFEVLLDDEEEEDEDEELEDEEELALLLKVEIDAGETQSIVSFPVAYQSNSASLTSRRTACAGT
jgi:hypothetical protein